MKRGQGSSDMVLQNNAENIIARVRKQRGRFKKH